MIFVSWSSIALNSSSLISAASAGPKYARPMSTPAVATSIRAKVRRMGVSPVVDWGSWVVRSVRVVGAKLGRGGGPRTEGIIGDTCKWESKDDGHKDTPPFPC